MRIKSIEISNYALIKSPITIDFKSNPITIIGRNGAGKSTILKLLNSIFTPDQFASNTPRLNDFEFFAELELSDKDISDLGLTAGIDYNLRVTRLSDHYQNKYEIDAKWYKEHLYKHNLEALPLAQEAQEVLLDIKKEVEKIINDYRLDVDFGRPQNGNFPLIEFKSKSRDSYFVYGFSEVINRIKQFIDQTQSIIDSIKDNDGKVLTGEVEFYDVKRWNLDFEFTYNIPKLDTNCLVDGIVDLVVDEEKLARTVDELNERFNRERVKLAKLTQKLSKYHYYAEKNYYRNEKENQKFFDKQLKLDHKINSLLSRNVKSLYSYYDENDYATTNVNKDFTLNQVVSALVPAKDIALNDDILKQINNLLKDIVPRFDNDMISEVRATLTGGKLDLHFVENDGSVTSFSKTSTGRKWYYAFKIISSTLNEGDVLILDEPGIYLHPDAQKELRKEIDTLAQNEIQVIMTTHSPFMIGAGLIHTCTLSKRGNIEVSTADYSSSSLIDADLVGTKILVGKLNDDSKVCEKLLEFIQKYREDKGLSQDKMLIKLGFKDLSSDSKKYRDLMKRKAFSNEEIEDFCCKLGTKVEEVILK